MWIYRLKFLCKTQCFIVPYLFGSLFLLFVFSETSELIELHPTIFVQTLVPVCLSLSPMPDQVVVGQGIHKPILM